MEKKLLLNKIQIIGFVLYFLILLTERIIALILSVNTNNEYGLINPSFISLSTYSITALSVLSGTILFIKPIYKMFSVLFTNKIYDFNDNIKHLIIASMVLLFSGMMHTAFTIATIQFVAYGFLLIALLAKTLEKPNKISITSFIYISLFSMSIPVVYSTFLSAPMNVLFYISEFLGVFILVPILGILFYSHYINNKTHNTILFPLTMIVLVALILGLKWQEEINYFVLIAASLTVVTYIPFKILSTKDVTK